MDGESVHRRSPPATSPYGMWSSIARPVGWIFAIPAFAFWFFQHVDAGYDARLRESALEALAADRSVSDGDRPQLEAFYGALEGGAICVSTALELGQIRQALGDACDDYGQFRWARRVAAASIGVGLATLAVGALATLAAFRARRLQIPAFRIAWNALRVASALQVAAQGLLLVALSYWVTVWWAEVYVPKLILIAAGLTVVGVGAILKAIFTKVDLVNEVEGKLVGEAEAPELWARLRTLAAGVGTEAPARVIAGIDDNFFVTEGSVLCEGQRHEGRSLFVSLALLRGMGGAEAEAVLCHELAHFSGGDTAHSRTLAPMLARYARYLDALRDNLLSLPVFATMLAFWQAFHLALARTSRERELRADRVAAEQTAPEAVARALLKVAAWSRYRAQVEQELFSQEQVLGTVAIADRVRAGFAAFARSPDLRELGASGTPHPMDSHPANQERFEALGVSLPESSWSELLLRPADDGWYGRIPVAAAIEAELWARYDARFAAHQRFKVALELSPTDAAGVALVEEYFPPLRFDDKGGAAKLHLSWELVEGEGFSLPLAAVTAARVDDGLLSKDLVLETGGGRQKIALRDLATPDAFLDAFGRYWGRAQVAARKANGA